MISLCSFYTLFTGRFCRKCADGWLTWFAAFCQHKVVTECMLRCKWQVSAWVHSTFCLIYEILPCVRDTNQHQIIGKVYYETSILCRVIIKAQWSLLSLHILHMQISVFTRYLQEKHFSYACKSYITSAFFNIKMYRTTESFTSTREVVFSTCYGPISTLHQVVLLIYSLGCSVVQCKVWNMHQSILKLLQILLNNVKRKKKDTA